MNRNSALEFLKRNQPFDGDDNLSADALREFADVQEYFVENPDPACIPLFINCFGKGSGAGLYQRCNEVFNKYSSDELVPHLLKGLNSPHLSIKYWSAQFSMEFPDVRLLDTLIDVVQSGVSRDTRFFSVAAICFIHQQNSNNRSASFIANQLKVEEDDEIIEVLLEHQS